MIFDDGDMNQILTTKRVRFEIKHIWPLLSPYSVPVATSDHPIVGSQKKII
jgi:hypothetical protein